ALTKVAKGVAQERRGEPAATPRPPDAEAPDPAVLRVAGGMPRVERERGELVSVVDQPPERRLVAVIVDREGQPLVERDPMEVPVVGEGFLVRLVDAFVLALSGVARGQAFRPDGLRDVVAEVDPHLEL